MSGEGATTYRGPIVRDETILRVVWSPKDVNETTREVMTSAFSSSDLRGIQNGFSVDRKRLATPKFTNALSKKQVAPPDKIDAWISEAHSDVVVSVVIDNAKCFEIIATPQKATNELPSNPAHSEIINISGKKGDGFVKNQLRVKLQPLFSKAVPFPDYQWPNRSGASWVTDVVANLRGFIRRLLKR
ncbi:hypothetical protein Rleg2_4150 [Rhizobium leguminosarum bv. trifolii WSM2304]|uniref:Uncharacterized protein n=1 Tax=Rhizobium leguminosarum bv. trifolii (strain WSM2304) TaxID=395492 RepID=A0ABF7QT51_RHILW|nr:hypothetical protein [Rhizobium leguminosarum]ACI57412.1 hypothetical protein Rleg2_4150 [Rhizobium leguminosarum bv. trifolii WSM2304]